jgi:hypothetical protein
MKLINKRDDADVPYFTEADEACVRTFTNLMAPILESSHLFTRAVRSSAPSEATLTSSTYKSSRYTPDASLSRVSMDETEEDETI